MDYKKNLDELKDLIQDLIEENRNVPIIVEGDKDISSLRKLGISGKIITTNSGLSLIDFCDLIAKKYNEIILLTDWDRKGGFLRHKIQKNLEGRVKCNTDYRKKFAKITKIKTVEAIPSWFGTLSNKIQQNSRN